MANAITRKVTSIKKLNDLARRDHIAKISKIKSLLPETRSKERSGRKIKSGYKVLFHGPPGTGKTRTAAVIGKETGRPVYRVDLSALISKYIGETEKNIEKLFKNAEDKGWILFFDEADVLFGKRTNVRDAHDRFANTDTNYLLQKIEEHKGLVILSTNFKKNIDPAFLRRIRFVLNFDK